MSVMAELMNFQRLFRHKYRFADVAEEEFIIEGAALPEMTPVPVKEVIQGIEVIITLTSPHLRCAVLQKVLNQIILSVCSC